VPPPPDAQSERPQASAPEVSVRVELGPRSYEVRVVSGPGRGFGAFARAALDATWAGRTCRRALLVTDANVAVLGAAIATDLEAAGIATSRALIPPGEPSKSLARATDLYDDLVRLRADRHTAIVAVGGGVVGDLAGFVAATYARGLPLLMVPTSLLAMVDSAVGGKVGVNHPRAKNIIGAFHQPVGVWIDTDALATLPPRELRCGLAEVIKYGVILDPQFFEFLEERAGAIAAREPDALRHIVAQSCRLKADVVARDEREEAGLRAILNFGHTVGHAVESVSGYGAAVHHGEAVAIGMTVEARLAEGLGWIERALTDRLVALIERFGLPTAVPPHLDRDALIDAMGRDKKNQRGQIRYILPHALGRVELTAAPTENDVRRVLGAGIAGGDRPRPAVGA
jgi:3-dehydroquinate synthase